MTKYTRFILLVFSSYFAVPTNLLAGQNLSNFSAEYVLSKGPVTFGKTIRSLQSLPDNRYQFKSVTLPKGIGSMFTDGEIVEQSIWTLHNNIVRPLEYSYANTASKKKRDIKLIFDWNANSVTNIINGDPWKMKLVPGTQDKLVYQLRIMLDLAEKRKILDYQVADGGMLKTFKVEILGESTLNIPLGTFHTTKVAKYGKNRTTILWCAHEINFLPVKIEQIKKDAVNINAILFKLQGINIPESVKPPKQTPKDDIFDDNSD